MLLSAILTSQLICGFSHSPQIVLAHIVFDHLALSMADSLVYCDVLPYRWEVGLLHAFAITDNNNTCNVIYLFLEG